MSTIITLAGESLIAAKNGAGQILNIDQIILANVPGLNPAAPIERTEGKPAAAQIVHTYTIPTEFKGYVNPNEIVYSMLLTSDVGPFSFNWLGLYSSADDTVVAITHLPTTQKTQTVGATLGNTLTRNFLLEFSGAQELTGVTIDAATWQIDFNVRLKGIDERARQANRNFYGRAMFFGDAFRVENASGFKLRPGTGYVEGIRVHADATQILTPGVLPKPVLLDVALVPSGSDVVPTVTPVFVDKSDYTDSAGIRHYVHKIAEINAAGVVTDLRSTLSADTAVESLARKNHGHELNDIEGLNAATLDKTTLLREAMNQLLSGQMLGKEGKWRCTHMLSLTPTDLIGMTTDAIGPCPVAYDDAVTGADSYIGSRSSLREDVCVIMESDIGLIEVAAVYHGPNGVRSVFAHPKYYGPAPATIWTIGKTYKIHAFAESTDPADQQTGDLDVVEYFLGGNSGSFAEAFGPSQNVSSLGTPTTNTGFDISGIFDGVTGVAVWVSNDGNVVDDYVGRDFGIAVKVSQIVIHQDALTENRVEQLAVDYWNGFAWIELTSINTAGAQISTIDLPTYDGGSRIRVRAESITTGGTAKRWGIQELILTGQPQTTTAVAGTHVDPATVISVGDYATLNCGYWNGKERKSQLLGDLGRSLARVIIPLSREVSGEYSACTMYWLNAAGQWVKASVNFDTPTAPLGWTYSTSLHALVADVESTWPLLGYTSEADMIAKGAAKVGYKTKARRLRSLAALPANIKAIDDPFYTNSYNTSYGVDVAYELTGNVHVGSGTASNMFTRLTRYSLSPATATLANEMAVETHELPDGCKNGVVLVGSMYEDGGQLKLAVYDKELVHDTDWGDAGLMPVAAGRITTIDDNGNVVGCGCMGVDLGISA